ncbi:Mov34/MPN/PAD-1 family protein [Parvularcula oceani]|uniref:Mov34/MPN/PAD-1 family protein n=1 Tax=Parvularcula oceani TaxID=1247963 RepID=UPI0006909A87|nr:Mov34/MPN/PAD-1 family protein [Parvularcula oceani]
MKLKISESHVARWREDLHKAGRREIGGVLFGEQIAEGEFRLIEATRQRFGGGGAVRFHRRGRPAKKQIEALHAAHGHRPERFNYLGEWHSHPNAPAIPSARDEATMHQLLADQAGAVNFLVLVIVRLSKESVLELSAATYLASGHRLPCRIVIDALSADPPSFDSSEHEL